jgi:aspartyl-tRNA(Asn)/glutamyl-tRNA(Gln) amidotransferase subunit A
MVMSKLTDLTLSSALYKLNNKEISSVELTQAHLDQIQKHDDQVKAFITVTPELALEQAKQADEARAKGNTAPLLGLPLAIKDVLSTKGVQTTCGSKILKGYKPVFNATVIQRLLDAGMVMVGKVNMDEFAMGSSTENSGYHITRNPWNLDRVPGGSSGGSGAVVSARMALAALGTDTGGSVRLPAAFCGIVGVKPSYGRASRYGLVAYGSSLDQPGPMARSVEDCARILQVIAGHDPLDSTSMNAPVPNYLDALKGGVKGLKIGLPKEYFGEGLAPDVANAIQQAIANLKDMGAEIVDVELPHSKYGLATYYIIAVSEASANLARYDGIRFGAKIDKGDLWDSYKSTRGEGFGEEVKRRIMLGTYALSAGYYDAWYGKAQAVRTLIKRDYDEVFNKVDVLCAPITPSTAFKIGDNSADPLQMYLADVMTVTANLAGICAMSVPCGFDSANLPIGLQILAPALKEDTLMRVGYTYEQAHDWNDRKPALIQ